MFCGPEHFFGGAEGVGSRFRVLRAGTRFRRKRGCRIRFHVLRARTHFRRYRGRPIPFSCFALPDISVVVPSPSGSVFKFSAPGLVFGITDGVGSRFYVLHSRTNFRR
jgi:hypothetical protein